MLLVHKDISHMPITELENNSESVWIKVFANKTSHYWQVCSRQPGGSGEDFQLFRDQLDHIRNQKKKKKKKIKSSSTIAFLLLQCSSGVVRHPRDLQVSVAIRFCRVLIFASS